MSNSIVVFRGRRVRIPGDSHSIETCLMKLDALMESTDNPGKREVYGAMRERMMRRLAAALWDENGLGDVSLPDAESVGRAL